ncbi:MAG: Bifunctional NAD(P)H-hydrate repair enzyme Nnr [Gemmatimonadaceae bacterium]|nr:Bifunctional NAD(P)H-hydrate repair enzyme Nnr [Gemmatimonadaceae bacterium]
MLRVVTADEASAIDRAAIASGTPSFALMQLAGERAAASIGARWAACLDRVVVCCGTGNNGGDGWIVATVLASRGHDVRVVSVGDPTTDDARRAAAAFRAGRESFDSMAHERPTLVVDAVLGTGASGSPRGPAASCIDAIVRWRAAGVPVVSLDVPSGLDATSGSAAGAVQADHTITFGTMKRGLLIGRGSAGEVTAIDIGLGAHAAPGHGMLVLLDQAWVAATIPGIPADSHKGTRRRLAIVGGDEGMAGATVLAARGAMRSGIGMVRLIVNPASLPVVQAAATEATALEWPADDVQAAEQLNGYAHVVLVGPGLGRTGVSRALLERVLDCWRGPIVIDADALTLFGGRIPQLRTVLGGRPALLTPHANECATLLGVSTDEVRARRFEIAFELATTTGAAVLLKGVPTVIAEPNGMMLVSAAGTPVLSAAGSGDVLGGIAATLLAQTADPFKSGAAAAWIHGRAAEIANRDRPIRGVTLDDVCHALADVWRFDQPAPVPPVLAELPAVGDDRRNLHRVWR